VFVTFEGIEGSGKSTQIQALATAFPDALITKEPGSTDLGRGIRELLLASPKGSVSPLAEVLLYFADRAQHVEEVVRPGLRAGRLVISDRYVDSSIAYQGHGRGLSLEMLRELAQIATGGLTPDLTIFLDVPVAIGLERMRARGAMDRIEGEAVAFHERVRDGYLKLIAAEPRRFVTIDGSLGRAEIQARVIAAVQAHPAAKAHAIR
jgi:dTMP kinase